MGCGPVTFGVLSVGCVRLLPAPAGMVSRRRRPRAGHHFHSIPRQCGVKVSTARAPLSSMRTRSASWVRTCSGVRPVRAAIARSRRLTEERHAPRSSAWTMTPPALARVGGPRADTCGQRCSRLLKAVKPTPGPAGLGDRLHVRQVRQHLASVPLCAPVGASSNQGRPLFRRSRSVVKRMTQPTQDHLSSSGAKLNQRRSEPWPH